ncbi:MAG: hypothetical protein FJW66_01780 [Actinobacteria bacterium]|nr:hypothetical protein [Actinomycetota bacterium]
MRIISVSDYYHFAFLVVSIALLGFGISGSFLYFFKEKIKSRSANLVIFGAAFAISLYLSFMLINLIPFDSFRIAWELRQVFFLAAYYFFLVLPFFFGGLYIGYIFYDMEKPGITYFYNLAGSATGSMFFLFFAGPAGKTGLVFISIGMAAVAAFLVAEKKKQFIILSIIFLIFFLQVAGIFYYCPELFETRMSPYKSLPTLLRIPQSKIIFSKENNYTRVDMIESPSIRSFPGLSLKYDGKLPIQLGITVDGDNLSPITEAAKDGTGSLSFFNYMPLAVVFAAAEYNTVAAKNTDADKNTGTGEDTGMGESSNAEDKTGGDAGNILVIEPGGGMDVLGFLYFADTQGSATDSQNKVSNSQYKTTDTQYKISESHYETSGSNYKTSNSPQYTSDSKYKILDSEYKIYVIQSNDLVSGILEGKNGLESISEDYAPALGDNEDVRIIRETSRSFIKRSLMKNPDLKFDIILVSLSDSFHPVSSGAYSLNENYIYTVESFEELIKSLSNDGILAINRWIQVPPSEGLKIVSALAESLDRLGIGNEGGRIFAFRSWSTITVLFKNDGFEQDEIVFLKNRLKDLNFDLVYCLGAEEAETNLFNQLATTDYFRYFKEILESDSSSRNELYQDYYFNIAPPTDNKPYFFDFFKPVQIPDIFKHFGKSTQPFGGGGYIVLFAALLISIILSVVFILVPLKFRRKTGLNIKKDFKYLVYFFTLGIGFFFIELPFIQKFIMILGKPSYSLAIVLFALMLSAGLGSYTGNKLRIKLWLPFLIIVLYIAAFVFLFVYIEDFIMAGQIIVRIFYTVLFIFPLGFFMGMPFPAGIEKAGLGRKEIIPWLWGINGCASVIGSISAVILSIHFGFLFVMGISALCYIAAYFAGRRFQ